MKPILKDGKLTVELHANERKTLEKTWDIAQLLIETNQPTGAPLAAALADILDPEGAEGEAAEDVEG